MKWVLGIAAALVAAYWVLRRRAVGNLLEARISTPDGLHYSVEFVELHAGAQPVEYVWLCILLAAKLLYNMGNDHKQADAKVHLLWLITILGGTDLSRGSSLVDATLEPIEVSDRKSVV